ncbi:MAG: O-antigen ligase family protein [Microbacterium sp.]
MVSVLSTETAAGKRTLPPSWPVWAATAAYPLWWALGLTTVIYPLLAVVLALRLLYMRRLKLPPGWLFWAMFLLVVVASIVMLDVDAPGTATQSGIGPYGAYALRFLDYLCFTLLLLYVGNHSEQTLPLRSVIAAFSSLAASVGLLGLAGTLLPTFSFRTPASYVLPEVLVGDGAARLAQVQDILGEGAAPRPSAPFDYTNTWGEVLSMAMVWLVVYAVVFRARRKSIGLVLGLSIIPTIASLNRGMWIGIVLTIAYVAVRLAMRLRLALAVSIVALIAVAGGVLAISPAGELIEARLESGHSDQIRENLANDSLRLANESPILGFGSTRRTQGSYESIAIGPSASCSQCGERVIGSTGQLWLLLVAQGWLGTILYFTFFAYALWTFRRDHSPAGIAASAVILLSIYYSYFYSAIGTPLAMAMLAVAMLWRSAQERSLAAEQMSTNDGEKSGLKP